MSFTAMSTGLPPLITPADYSHLAAPAVSVKTADFVVGTFSSTAVSGAFSGQTATYQREYDIDDTAPINFKVEWTIPINDMALKGLNTHERRRHAILTSLIMVRTEAKHFLGARCSRLYSVLDLNLQSAQEHLNEVLHNMDWHREEFGYNRHHQYQANIERTCGGWNEANHLELQQLIIARRINNATITSARLKSDPVDQLPDELMEDLKQKAFVAGATW